MYRYIGIEDLVASALIELMKHENATRKISLQTLSEYGTTIVKFLTKQGQNAILFLTKESTYEFVHDYAEFFAIETYSGIEYIELRDSVTIEDLRSQFRKNLTVDLAKALVQNESLSALNIKTVAR